MPHQFGEKIKRARENLGLTQEDLALAVGLSSEFISNIESGRRFPSFENLITLVNYLQKDFSYFLEEKKPIFKELLSQKTLSEKEKNEILLFEKYCQDYLMLEEVTGRRLDLAPLSYSTSPELMAAEERRRLGLMSEPIRDIFNLIEINGLRACRINLPKESKITGVFVYFPSKEAAFTLINSSFSIEQQSITAAHQYCHYLKDRLEGPIIDNTDIFVDEHLSLYHPREKFAQVFAQNFMVPPEKVHEIIQKDIKSASMSPEYVIYLKRYFGVDTTMMLAALREMNILSYSTFYEFKKLDSVKYEEELYGKSGRLPKDKKKPIPSERFRTLAVIVCRDKQ
jgi:transcriptional regulator with XRE-family HTH domain